MKKMKLKELESREIVIYIIISAAAGLGIYTYYNKVIGNDYMAIVFGVIFIELSFLYLVLE